MFARLAHRWLLRQMAAAVTTLADVARLADFTQSNRRVRKAWRSGRAARCQYLYLQHQQRRLRRRAEIRALVEGPVGSTHRAADEQ